MTIGSVPRAAPSVLLLPILEAWSIVLGPSAVPVALLPVEVIGRPIRPHVILAIRIAGVGQVVGRDVVAGLDRDECPRLGPRNRRLWGSVDGDNFACRLRHRCGERRQYIGGREPEITGTLKVERGAQTPTEAPAMAANANDEDAAPAEAEAATDQHKPIRSLQQPLSR